MATRIATKCRAIQCPSIAGPKGYCLRHQQPYDAKRQRQKNFYASPEWRALRRAALARDPYCKRCTAPSSHADHIIPREQGGADDMSNLQGLCQMHHSAKTARESGWGR